MDAAFSDPGARVAALWFIAMTEDLGVWAAGLLVNQAWDALRQGRFQEALAAAAQAVEAAGQLDDPVLLVRALQIQANTLQMTADYAAALAGFTKIMALAEDPATSGRLDDPKAAEAVAAAYWNWVESARSVGGIPVRELFTVLDAGDRWLTAIGHRDWRAAILSERASVHNRLGEREAAVAAAEEALAVAIQHPYAPGYALTAHRSTLADILRDAGRDAEAGPQYQAILDDPDATLWARRAAHKGLARCALAAGDPGTARREARTAVLLAESLGDEALCTSLDVLAEACRADGDLEAAWQAATRRLEAAGRIGGHYRPFYAARMAADVALDRGDLAAARRLVAELDEHAAALDADGGTTSFGSEAAQRRHGLARLEETAP
jgi:tetratricopeptide (TPR) repeat protein